MPDRGARSTRAGVATAAVVTALAALLLLATNQPAGAWNLSLVDSVTVSAAVVRVADLARGSIPPAAAAVVVMPAGKPGQSSTVERQLILRRLVSAGQASGVSFRGAEICQVLYGGLRLNSGALSGRVHDCVAVLLPPALPEAPPTWWVVELPDLDLAVAGDWEVALAEPRRLQPGRNLVPLQVGDGRHNYRFSAKVTVHAFGEIAQTVGRIARDTSLRPEQMAWEWCDLATVASGLVVGRDEVTGCSAARELSAGQPLRKADLKPTPLILAGQPIELRIGRGRVAVAVRAVARQPGQLGQIISVRNELTGRLVTARVAGPGLVEWSR